MLANRLMKVGDIARVRHESFGVFGVDPHLDGVAVYRDVVLGDRQLFTSGDPQLQFHQVQAGHHLGHAVLHLEPGVHLEEEDAAVRGHQELNGAGAGIADEITKLGRQAADPPA